MKSEKLTSAPVVVIKFDREKEWPFERMSGRKKSGAERKRQERNTNLFGEWLINLLKTNAPRELDQGDTYDTTAVRMHPENNEYLREYIYPMDWMNYSPRDDETVPTDEVHIDWFFFSERERNATN